jgi:succinate dehydrogenase / fumarate reductase cytochrome b subunit
MRARPVSPHLSVYRFAYTMALSITHRVTGAALAAGLPLLAYWLMAVAGGREAYDRAAPFFDHVLVRILLLGWLAAFAYHLANGVRHLMWDTGRGLEKREARLSGAVMVLTAVALFVALAALALTRWGGA